jgi:hypothetical protein
MRAPLASCALLCACTAQPVDPAQVTPPDHVATLNVTLEGDGSLDPAQVQLAIVWFRDRQVWPQRALEPQELLITQFSLTWPVSFEAILTDPPSYDPYYSAPTVGARPGRLVAYLDDNHNGRLDFTRIDASAFTDRIVGYATGNTIMHYSTVNVIAQQVYTPNVGPTDVDISTPITLPARASLRQSCHLLEDWQPHFAYASVFGGIPLDPNDPSEGPWDYEAASDAICPNNELPADTDVISCDAPPYQYHAEAIAQTSPFIAQTCGQVSRVCEIWHDDPNAPSLCPCDPSLYGCVDYEGGL